MGQLGLCLQGGKSAHLQAFVFDYKHRKNKMYGAMIDENNECKSIGNMRKGEEPKRL